jgi:hypothetical protein
MDPKGKGMVINDKEKETLYVDEPKGDKWKGNVPLDHFCKYFGD